MKPYEAKKLLTLIDTVGWDLLALPKTVAETVGIPPTAATATASWSCLFSAAHLRTENIEERCWCGAGVAGRLCDETAVFVFGQVGTRRRLSACSKTPWCQDEVLGARDQ
ncbi:unnamed protein product [Ectocarpus sp. 13 AM-2016]